MAAMASADAAGPVESWSDSAIEACENVPDTEQDACIRDEEARERARAAVQRKLEARYLRPLAERLAASGDPRKLAVAANLWPSRQGDPVGSKVRQWRERAFDQGGDDPDVAVLLQSDRSADAGPVSVTPVAGRALERWRASEPGNLVPAMDPRESIEVLLARADTFDRFSLHFSDLLLLFDSAFAAFPPDRAQRRLLRALEVDPGSLSARYALTSVVEASPSFMPLVNACKGAARQATPTRNAECRHLGRVMLAHSDTVLGELFGAALLRYDDDPALRAEGDATRRRWRWQSERLRALGERTGADCTPTKMRATPGMGEGDAIRACLADAGVPLEPPADWNPDASQAETH